MSLLDHVEDPSYAGQMAQGGGTYAPATSSLLELSDPGAGGWFGQARDDDGEPRIFALDRVQFSFPDELLAVAVSNNMLCVALRTHTPPKELAKLRLLRIDLDKPDAVEDIVFTSKQRADSIQRIFYSPSAHHLLISCQSGENYYLHARWTKPRLLSKIKGVRLRSVAWGPEDGADTTGPLLLGSSQGHVFETELLPIDNFFQKEERYFSQVFSLHHDAPVIGLHYAPVSSGRNRYAVIMTTPTRIYQMVGDVKPTDTAFFATLFGRYDGNAEFQEVPSSVARPAMRVLQSQDANGHPNTLFGWLTGPGLFFGKVTLNGKSFGDSLVDSPQILPYATPSNDAQIDYPASIVSFVLTDYHFVVVLNGEMVVISTISHQIVWHEPFMLSPNETIIGMAADPIRKTYWAYTNMNLYEVIITDEDRDIWKVYLDKRQFDQATAYAKTDVQRKLIFEKQADACFAQKQFARAAELYALTDVSFEEICLRFIGLSDEAALTVYLRKKLSSFKKQDLTQTTLIGTWLMELLASKLCAAEQQHDALRNQAQMNGGDAVSDAKLRDAKQQYTVLTSELRTLLKDYKDRLHHPTVYSLLGSHGRSAEVVYFAELIGDWEKLVTFYTERREWHKALDIVSRQDSVDFYYKHSATLIQHIPREVIGLWIKVPSLNPRFLMPSILNVHNDVSTGMPHASLVNYLEHLVASGNRDRVVHNYLFRLYASQSTHNDEAPVLAFLNTQRESPAFDLPYAVRVCIERRLVQSSVQLYALMGLYDEAIHLALDRNDLELARIIAEKPDDHEDTRKRLWLRIAQHVIRNASDVKSALDYLKVGNLKIEEILPFFPDFVFIDDFKDELCSALEDYNEYIHLLKSDLDETTKASESIRLDIRELKNRYIIVPVAEKCHHCDRPLLTRQFYAFPCHHTFHADCLMDSIVRDSIRGKKVLMLRSELEKDSKDQLSTLLPAAKLRLKDELDDLVSQECVLCGEAMIKSIDTPFMAAGETL
ncbi:Pep3/Vps18/deep orange family-domain-containing protein [Entophlyctis helioformis]|nr:Pep3/Vps18/deep orange family-domain-containing protein [Entophlyctis helioformis]